MNKNEQVNDTVEKFNKAIKAALKENEKTQKAYAAELNIGEASFSNYINGKNSLSFSFLTEAATNLNLDLNHIFKPDSVKLYALSDDELALHKALKSLPKNKKAVLFADFMNIIDLIKQ